MGPKITPDQSHVLFQEPLSHLPFDGDTVAVTDSAGTVVAYVLGMDNDELCDDVKGDSVVARAARIAACVNYCKGIPTDDILAGSSFFQGPAPRRSSEQLAKYGLASYGLTSALLHLRDHGTVAVDAPCEVCGGTGGKNKVRSYCRYHPDVDMGENPIPLQRSSASRESLDRLPCGCPWNALREITDGCADCNNTGKITARVTMAELALLLVGGNSDG